MNTSQESAAASPPPKLAQVALEAAVPKLYSYLVPWPMAGVIEVGQAVLAPLGRGVAAGYVLSLGPAPTEIDPRLKPLTEILVQEPLFGPSLSRLINFTSHYYFYPPGLCAKEILPGGLAPKLETMVVLNDGPPPASRALIGAEAELLARLAEAGGAGCFQQELLREGYGSVLKQLLIAGRISLSRRPIQRGPRPSYEWWLAPSPTPPATPVRLGPKERALWEMAQSGPAKPLSYFAAYLINPLPQAKSLAAKGLIILSQQEVFRDDPNRAINDPSYTRPIPNLTQQQQTAWEALDSALTQATHQGVLLFGVTGSGKTELYLRAAEKALDLGREVLWLAPEIALTLGLEGRLKSRLTAQRVAVLHSGLTPAQRHDQWRRIRRGQAQVVLGARSAVFAPLENLGLVVVDEEHDWAYKQDDGLHYNGRDLARWRAAEAGAVLILGSATPSFESYQNALDGRLTLLKMTDRPGQALMPKVELLDQRAEPARQRQALSPILRQRLGETIARGEQALLFLNRRGLANLPMCLKCGETLKCPHCSRTLTLHGPDQGRESTSGHAELEPRQVLICHSCGYRADPPQSCPACFSPLFRYFGVGTEKLLELAEKHFPQVRGGRLDTDSVRLKGGLKNILSQFAQGELNLLVGTQMAAKGHDFPNLTLVGVVDADLGLNLPDFRAAERTFQLLSQVSGRAGRADRPGTVFIQTMTPTHQVLRNVADHDFESFFASEIIDRERLSFPPFARLALVRLSGPDEAEVVALAEELGTIGQNLAQDFEPALDLLGPIPSPWAKIKNRYRFQFMVKTKSVTTRHLFLEQWLPKIRAFISKDLRLTVDIDPYHLL